VNGGSFVGITLTTTECTDLTRSETTDRPPRKSLPYRRNFRHSCARHSEMLYGACFAAGNLGRTLADTHGSSSKKLGDPICGCSLKSAWPNYSFVGSCRSIMVYKGTHCSER
jgi:hypothetical protein